MDLETGISLACIIIGILLLITEAATPGSFIIIPGTVVLVLGIIWLINPDWIFTIWSPIIAIIVVIPMILVTIKLYQLIAPPAPPETTVATSLIGKTGIVTKAVKPNEISGKVRINNDMWSATAARDIPEGARVLVVKSEGVHVTVEEIQK